MVSTFERDIAPLSEVSENALSPIVFTLVGIVIPLITVL
jgi:hypothetical protein